MSMTQDSARYFEQVASRWDQISAGYFGAAVRDEAIAKAYLRPEMVVADVGAGTGFVAAGLAPLVRQVEVVDGSAAMLAVARENLRGFANIAFHEADGANLPFPDESLDAVFANMYLHHAVDPLAAVREMVRVLRPGGRLVITDMDSHPYAWLKDEMADVWQGFDQAQVRAWFEAAGLVNVMVGCTSQSCCAQSANPAITDEQGREAVISVFLATGTRRMAMRDAVRENYAAVARSGGSCGCTPAPAGDGAARAPQTGGCCAAEGPQDAAGGCCGAGASAGDGCCGGSEAAQDGSMTFATGYSPAELSDAPDEAAQISLGCGNPLAFASLKPGEVVLDVGSGGGLDAFLAAKKVGPAGRVIGVDMTSDMLERARASAQRSGIDNVEFRQGFAEALPVADGEVDVIISNCVINLTEDKGHVFREAFRALKPGGRLEVSDVVTGGPLPLDGRADAAGWAECVSGALPEREYLDLIAQAGFVDVSARRSASSGQIYGQPVYSVVVSARKPSPFTPRTSRIARPQQNPAGGCGCGGGSDCCGAPL